MAESRPLWRTLVLRPAVRLLRAPVQLVRRTGLLPTKYNQYEYQSLPVAGLSVDDRCETFSWLQHLAKTDEEQELVRLWQKTLELSQEASTRLQHELYNTMSDISFWQRQIKRLRTHHFAYQMTLLDVITLPIMFFTKAFRRAYNWALDLPDLPNTSMNQEDLADRRLMVLVACRRHLATALSVVHTSAARLLVVEPGALWSDVNALVSTPGPLGATRQGILQCCASITCEYWRLQHAAASLRKGADLHAPLDVKSLVLHKAEPPSVAAEPCTLEQVKSAVSFLERTLDVSEEECTDQSKSLTELAHLDSNHYLSDNHQAYWPKVSSKPTSDGLHPLTHRYQVGVVPPMARRPLLVRTASEWLRVIAGALVGGVVVTSAISKYRSGELDQWRKDAVSKATSIWTEHVVEPLLDVQADLFGQRKGGLMDEATFVQSQLSLDRMLQDFAEKKGKDEEMPEGGVIKLLTAPRSAESSTPAAFPHTAKELDSEALSSRIHTGMDIVMHSYEKQLEHPLRNMVMGDLARTLLIQIQKVKVESEAAMQAMDQILRANELTIAMVAALPALLLLGLVLSALRRGLQAKPLTPGALTLKLRMNLVQMERALHSACCTEDPEKMGMFLYRLNNVYRSGQRLFKRNPLFLEVLQGAGTEWPHIKADILDMASPKVSSERKLATACRMQRVYSCLSPPVRPD